MTTKREREQLGEDFLTLCNLVCERTPPPFKPYLTKLQGAALQLQRFATRCRDDLIDARLALRQAIILMREQPTRTAEDYASEAKKAAEAAQASDPVPGPDTADQCPPIEDNGTSTGCGAGDTH